MSQVSQGGEQFAAHHDTASRPSFEQALRGYDKRQVDQYVAYIDSEMWRLTNEREQMRRQLQDMATRLDRSQSELTELKQQPPQIDRASVRDVGPMVDQILTLADKQAKAVKDEATEWAGRRRAEAEKEYADARERAEKLQSESQAAYEQARQEAQRIGEQSAQQLEEARAEAARVVEEARAYALQEVEAARAETDREVQARQQRMDELQAELDAARHEFDQARQGKAGAERDVEQLRQRYREVSEGLAAELNRLEEARRAAEDAERHAERVRARVHREAQRVAQMAAAAVMAAAERGAEPTGEYPLVPLKAAGDAPPDGTAPSGGTAPPETPAWPANESSDAAAPPAAPSGGSADPAAAPPDGTARHAAASAGDPTSPALALRSALYFEQESANAYDWFDKGTSGEISTPPAAGTADTGTAEIPLPVSPDHGPHADPGPHGGAADLSGEESLEHTSTEAIPMGPGPSAGAHAWQEPDPSVPAQRHPAEDAATDTARP